MEELPVFMTQLREMTHSQHMYLERQTFLSQLMNPRLDYQQYEAIVRCFAGFYSILERDIAVSTSGILYDLNWQGRRKMPALQADIATFAHQEVVMCEGVPSVMTDAEILGVLYVTEGATLGGQLICKHLRDTVGIAPHQLNFFGGYGRETAHYWRAYQAMTEGYAQQHIKEQTVIIQSAREAFELLTKWVEDCLVYDA